MANHGFITSKRNFKSQEVFEVLQEINQRRFKGLLEIDPYTDGWSIGYKDPSWKYKQSFNLWITSPKKLEHRHCSGWIFYLEIVFANELALKYNSTLSDEGHDQRWKPDPEKYKTYRDWLAVLNSYAKEKHPIFYKGLVLLELKAVPKLLRDC